MKTSIILGVALLLLAAPSVFALDVHSDGSDGALSPSASVVIHLENAPTGNWETTPGTGAGVYDSTKWAVVFKYSSVNITSGKTVTFINHSSRCPAVWLVDGDVTIAGTVQLSGAAGTTAASYSEPGPGGFRGGKSAGAYPGCAGFGPGGGGYNPGGGSAGGGYGSIGSNTGGGAVYGNPTVNPLIGGSGGGGAGNGNGSGGAGGGAILIACSGTMTIAGQIVSGGGSGLGNSGGGSGGAIRLIANAFGAGSVATGLTALGGSYYYAGGVGRIRIEANNTAGMVGTSNPPAWVFTLENDTADLWPLPAAATVKLVSVGGVAAPADPRGSFGAPGDLWVTEANGQEVILESTNVPTDGTWEVKVRLAPVEGDDFSPQTPTTLLEGSVTWARWHATLPNLPNTRVTALQGRAAKVGS